MAAFHETRHKTVNAAARCGAQCRRNLAERRRLAVFQRISADDFKRLALSARDAELLLRFADGAD
jgi:hypothetical protein